MAYKKGKKKTFLTKEDKQKMIESYQEKIDSHFLSIADRVSEYFVKGLEEKKPIWLSSAFKERYNNPESGTQYNFENSILLALTCEQEGYKDKRFITAKQGFDNGLTMEKGTKGHYIVQRFGMPMFPILRKDDKGNVIKDIKTGKPLIEKDEEGKNKYFYQRVSKLVSIFNIEQFKGEIPQKWNKNKDIKELSNAEEILKFRDILEKSSEVPILRHNDATNYYNSDKDIITLSNSELFRTPLNEVSTMTHEMSHATGHEDRLDRESLRRYHEHLSFRGYEELVANFSARALTQKYGLSNNEMEDAYLNNHDTYDIGWMGEVVKKNPILIFEATRDAELAYRKVVNNLEKQPELKALLGVDEKIIECLTKKQEELNPKKELSKKIKP